MNDKLPPAVARAIGRAAKRISSYASCDRAGMVSIITEELRPVLLGGPSGSLCQRLAAFLRVLAKPRR